MCQLLNYDYRFIEINNSKYVNIHPATKKINVIHDFLHNCDYDIMIFVDSDAWIQNPNYIRDIVNELLSNQEKQGCFSRDPYTSSNTFINSGSFILKVNDYTKNMYAEILKHLHHDSRFHSHWPYDQYYISHYTVLNRHHFNIFISDILNTPIGRALRHNWWKNADMYNDMNVLLQNEINLSDETIDFRQFLDDTPIIEEYNNVKTRKEAIMEGLKNIITECKSLLEGNSFYYHSTLNIYPELFYKQMNLFWLGKKAETRICEIGFNAGHSTMLMLLGRDDKPIDFTVFDIGHHDYTKPCLSYIKNQFPHVSFEYVEGDSTVTMPEWIKLHSELIGTYDLVHVDGGHSEYCIVNDMKNADLLVRKGGFIIVDDTHQSHINRFVDDSIQSGNYIEIKYCVTTGYPHRILKKCVYEQLLQEANESI